MPRQSRPTARPAAARPSVPAKPAVAPTQQQTRPAATLAAPLRLLPLPRLLPPLSSQLSSSRALVSWARWLAPLRIGVAIGSSIGHVIGNGISSLFGGSSSEAAAPAPQANAAPAQQQQTWGGNCAEATQQFTKCMDEHGGNMSICNWYLEQLKACQQAAKQF
ncbi:uncharacterized protein CTHT_0013090 [Thermochaetoides thermophila DSM 1495]|uniref:CHCH domain-containing protein n=1 Tax=Chaetomium thermophilum (strain DSM 1495 / CBS 144.50 / IMI 039719) TaxID=759272 RepID=G0S1C3_CHATD|nr:hypothetical protein CTHT_0013090 [Thermochaetoides thermophila DSM 1495]EGS22833.1 hypothetical protein CTHT_0013090 [Thermochaetoides thermophila DSM 1495]